MPRFAQVGCAGLLLALQRFQHVLVRFDLAEPRDSLCLQLLDLQVGMAGQALLYLLIRLVQEAVAVRHHPLRDGSLLLSPACLQLGKTLARGAYSSELLRICLFFP